MEGKTGMLIGEKGVKYGLQKPGPKKSVGLAQGAAAAKPKPTNVFGADSDSDEDVGAQIARQAEKKRAAAKVQQVYEAALTEDASIFDYDGVYDSIQQARVQPKQQEKIERKSRYIAQLKEQAEQRKRENDVAFERKALKDRVKEDHLFADKEVFVTGAYRRKLEEQQRWLEAEKRKEEEEAKKDVRKIGHMGNFYANLLSGNVAFGTSKDVPPKDKDDQEGAGAEPAARGSSEGPDSQGASKRGGSEPPRSPEQATDADDEAALAAAAAKAGLNLDKYELMRLQAEKAMRQRTAAGQGTERSQALDQAEPSSSKSQPEDAAASKTAESGGVAEEATEAAPPAAHAAKRRNDDSSVQSAKERYLARKKQALGQA